LNLKIRTKTFFALGAFLIPFTIYLITICPTVHLGDSGELNLAAATLSIPHVPGYPLLVSIGHAFCRTPFGSGAFRGNLFSAFFGALASLLFYLFLLRKTGKPVVAFAFALCLAGGFTMWEQSLKIRAYPLNAAFAIGVIYLTDIWLEKLDRRYLYAVALLLGLGIANHEILLVVGAVPFVAMLANIKKLKVGQVLIACLFGILGLSFYLYLPLRASADPVLNWGDPATFSNLIDVLTQAQYRHKMLSPDWGPKIVMIGMILKSFLTEFGPFAALLGLVGLFFSAKKYAVLTIGFLLTIFVNIALRINYIGDSEFFQVLRYMLTSMTAFVFFAAIAGNRIVNAILLSRFSEAAKRFMVGLFLVAIAISPFAIHSHKNDLSAHRIGYDYIHSVLDFPESDYTLAVGGDNNVFPLWYLQRFEKYRADVVVLPKQTFRSKWLTDEVAAQLPDGATEPRIRYADLQVDQRFFSTIDRLVNSGRPVYSLFDSLNETGGSAAMADLTERFGLYPCAMAMRFSDKPDFCSPDSYLWQIYSFDSYTNPKNYHDHHTSTLLDNAAVMVMRRGKAFEAEKKMGQAMGSHALSADILPEDPSFASNLANTLARVGNIRGALDIYDELIGRFPQNDLLIHNRRIIANALSHGGEK